MMDVQTMRHIVDDLERGTMPVVVREAVLRWCGPGDEVNRIRYVWSSANHLFRFIHEGHPRYLRLSPASERQGPAIAAELDFVEHVAHLGLGVARPVVSANGRGIEEVSAHRQCYAAVVFEGLRGTERALDDLDEAGYQSWGRALAVVHAASQTFPPHPARPDWRDDLREALRSLPAHETTVAQVLTSGLRWLDTLVLPEGNYGLLHGDFELDNVLWDDGQLQALDFDDATYAWYTVDFAAALLDVSLAGEPIGDTSAQRNKRIGWFTQGYATVRPLPDGLGRALPQLVTLLLAHKIARLLRAYATASEGNAPAWLATMRAAHQEWLRAKRVTLVRAASVWM